MPTMNDQSSESSQALQNPLVSAEHENTHQNKTHMPKVNANIPQPAMHTQLLESATSSAKAVIDGKGRSATNENMTQSSIRELSATSLSAEGAASGQNPITNVTQMQSTTEIKSVQDQSTHSLPCISPSFLSVGRMVRVERRNIPGEKLKEEANGKITKIHTKEVPISEVMINEGVPVENIDASNIVSTVIAVDVKWVLGGGERKILVEHVTHAPELETNSGNNLRDRNDDSRKRCPFCPSFIKDCQLKCHEYIEYVKQKSMVPEKLPSEKQQAPEEKVERQPRQKKKKKKQRDRKEYLSEHQQLALKGGDMKQLEDDEESLSSMDSEEEEEHAVSVFKRFRRLMGRGENVTLEKLAKQKERQMHKQKQNHKRQWRQPSSSCALGSLPSPTVMGNETTANSTSAKKRKRDSVIASRDNDKSNFDFEADEATDDDVEIINQEDYQEELLTPREGYLVDSDLDDEESGNDGDNMVLRTLGNVDFQGDQDDSSDDSSIEVGIGNEDFETTNNPSPSYSSDDNSNECGKFSADDGAFAGDEDDNFLQGEGHAAAENLPCDITDTTKTLRYGELPQFIDVLALKIDEERIPHAQYQLSLLKGRLSLARREVGSIKSFDELNILFKKR